MSGLVKAVSRRVPDDCVAKNCKKDGCSVSMRKAPKACLIVDLDCRALDIPRTSKRCDYLFVGEEDKEAWVVPIELKSGGFEGGHVAEQLQGGANAAAKWLPAGSSFRFVPVLVHGKSVHREDRKKLRDIKIKLRKRKRKTELIRCGEALRKVLDKA